RRLANLASPTGGDVSVLSFRQTDQKFELEWTQKFFPPVIRECFASDSAHEFVQKKSKCPRVIAMGSSRRPQGRLRFQRPNHSVVIEHINPAIQSAKPRLMGKQLCNRDLVFASLRKLRPDRGTGSVDLDLFLLYQVQPTRAAIPLGGRQDQPARVGCPRFFAVRVQKPAVKINQRLSVLPNRNRRT